MAAARPRTELAATTRAAGMGLVFGTGACTCESEVGLDVDPAWEAVDGNLFRTVVEVEAAALGWA